MRELPSDNLLSRPALDYSGRVWHMCCRAGLTGE